MAERVPIETHVRLADYAAIAHLASSVRELQVEAAEVARKLNGRTLWMVSSTARGGGVAEMLPAKIAILRELGIATEWVVIAPVHPEFFGLTKRLHNMLHGQDAPALTAADRDLYETVSNANVVALRRFIRRNDVVIVHDPQPLGVGRLLKQGLGVPLIWRCHIGIDENPPVADAAWEFLRPYATAADHTVFSAAEYIPSYLSGHASVVFPGIDPLGHKNRELSLHKLVGVLCDAALVVPQGPLVYNRFAHPARRLQTDGTWAPASLPEDFGLLTRPMVVQISRWDRLKGWLPLLHAFRLLKEGVQPVDDVHRRRLELVRLVLAGPDPEGVADDPEGQEVVQELRARYLELAPSLQRDVALIALPMASRKENALMVNALQRAASIVVQNSLREGFGLTVAEAMWKRAPVLANARAVGLRNQVRDGVDGRLVRDPEDAAGLASALGDMLADPHAREQWGIAGQHRVHEEFLVFSQLRRWMRVLTVVLS